MMWRYVQQLLGVLVLTALVLGAGSFARADVTITMEAEVTTPQGAQKTTVTQYYTPTKMRSERSPGRPAKGWWWSWSRAALRGAP